MRKLHDIEFVPVLDGCSAQSTLTGKTLGGKELNFITENSIYQHDSLLLNPAVSDTETVEKLLPLIRKDVLLFADSGGFQFTTGGGKFSINVENLIEWQENHAHIGFTFDLPPFIVEKDNDGNTKLVTVDKQKFTKFAEVTKENTDRMLAGRKKSSKDFLFYSIIHGHNYEEFSEWYKIVKADVDGYSVKSMTNSPLMTAVDCSWAYENLDCPIHFLGVGKLSRSIIPIYFGQYYKKPISFDSSTFAVGSQYRRYTVPFIPRMDLRFLSESKKCNSVDFCYCPICTEITKNHLEEELYGEDGTKAGNIFNLHNFFVMRQLVDFFWRFRENRPVVDEAVSKIFNHQLAEKVKLGMDFIDMVVDVGYEKASKKFRVEEKSISLEQNIKQKTLGGYY